ncbi:MAG TPA: hypothetical protein VG815_01005, partial [Chloroflexota bacterium]|nr:hypothetical protein [Chloroflexota bacterium]
KRSIASAETDTKLSFVAWMEPTRYTLTIQDPTKPAGTRFLTVLQGADKGAAMVGAKHVRSLSGAVFDGARFGSSVVYFVRTLHARFRGATLSRPAHGTVMLVTGLPARVHIRVSVGARAVTVAPGGTSRMTDASGVLRLVF